MESGLCRQGMLSLLVSTMALSSGMATGWSSTMASKLQRFDSPVGRMNKQEISYLYMFPLYAGVFLSIFYGFVAQKFGRKDALVCVGLPSIVSGVLLSYPGTKIGLYVGRCFAGCTMIGGVMAPLMYVSETANDSIRGTLMALLTFVFNAGFFLAHVLGDTLSYKAFNFFGIAIPAVSSILMLAWLPESPHFLMNNGRIKDAMRSLQWLRGGDHAEAKADLECMKPDQKKKNLGSFQIVKSRSNMIALIIGMIAYILQSLSGILAILQYNEQIFKEASYNIMSINSSLTTGVLILVSSLICIFIIDSTERRTLLYISFAGCSVGLAASSSYLYVKLKGSEVSSFGWIGIIGVSLFIVSFEMGLATVPGVLTNELAAPNVKPLICSAIGVITILILIAVLKLTPYLHDNIGLYSVFAISSAVDLCGVFYTWFLVPATTRKPLTRIYRELRGERFPSHSASPRV